jgi:hypothetical protein
MDSSETADQAAVVREARAQTEAEAGPKVDQQPDLLSDLQKSGCPVCNHLVKTAFEFFCKWQCRLSADEPTQRAFADQLGFCALHTWQLAAVASPLGLSLGYPKLLERLSAVLSSLSGEPSEMAGPVTALVPSRESCQVCGLLRSEEQERIARFSQFLAEPAGRDAYTRCQGVCLRHLASLLAASPPTDVARFLLSEAARQFDQLAENMRNYALKRNAGRRVLVIGDEDEAHLRALVRLAGHKALCAPR